MAALTCGGTSGLTGAGGTKGAAMVSAWTGLEAAIANDATPAIRSARELDMVDYLDLVMLWIDLHRRLRPGLISKRTKDLVDRHG